MKRGISVFLAGILMMTLTACGGGISEKIAKRYRNLQSYTGSVTVTVTGNKGAAVYEMRQSYQAPDSYRLEVVKPENLAGTVSVMRGREFRMKSGDSAPVSIELAEMEKTPDFLFLDSMLKDFYHQDSVPALTEREDGTILMSEPVQEANRYRFHRNLIFDGKSLLPLTLITFDRDGNEVLRVEFSDFVRNAGVDEETFFL